MIICQHSEGKGKATILTIWGFQIVRWMHNEVVIVQNYLFVIGL